MTSGGTRTLSDVALGDGDGHIWLLRTKSSSGELEGPALVELDAEGVVLRTVKPDEGSGAPRGWSALALTGRTLAVAGDSSTGRSTTSLEFWDLEAPQGSTISSSSSSLRLCSRSRGGCGGLKAPPKKEEAPVPSDSSITIRSLSFAPGLRGFVGLLESPGPVGHRVLVSVDSHGDVEPLFPGPTQLTTEVQELTDVAVSNGTLVVLCGSCGRIYEADLQGRILSSDSLVLEDLGARGLSPRRIAASPSGGKVAVLAVDEGREGHEEEEEEEEEEGRGPDGAWSLHFSCAGAAEPLVRALSTGRQGAGGPGAWPSTLMDAGRTCCYFEAFCHADNCAILDAKGWAVELAPGESLPGGDFGIWPAELMDEGRTCCTVDDICSPWHCDFLVSKGWEVPLREPLQPQPPPPAAQELPLEPCPIRRLSTPAKVAASGAQVAGLAMDAARHKFWALYNAGDGGFKHWLVQYSYDGHAIRTLRLFGPTNPTGLAWMGDDTLGVVDGSELSVSSVYVGPGAGDSAVPGLGLTGVVPQRRVFFSSPAWSSDSGEVLSGLAYDPSREHFYAVRSPTPRSVYLLRWDGTGDHLFELSGPEWALDSDAVLTGLSYGVDSGNLFIAASSPSSTVLWEAAINGTRIGSLDFGASGSGTIPNALSVSADGAEAFLATTGGSLLAFSSGDCATSSLGAFTAIQQTLKGVSSDAAVTGLLAPASDLGLDGAFSAFSGNADHAALRPSSRISSGRFGFGFGFGSGEDSVIPGLQEFLWRAKAAGGEGGASNAAFDPGALDDAASKADPLLPESLLDLHNEARWLHGALPLAWDKDLARKAAEGARRCDAGAASGGINAAVGMGVDFVEAALDWYRQGQVYITPGSAEGFTNMVWKASEFIGCGLASCPDQETAVVCMYDPPGNVFGGYSANVQPSPGAAGPLPKDIPAFLVAAFQQSKGGAGSNGGSGGGRDQQEQQEGAAAGAAAVAAALVADLELEVAGPDTPRSFASASRVPAGELSDPLQAPNLLLDAPTHALNFLAVPYELPRFQVPEGYEPRGIDIGCLSLARSRCPSGFFECRGLCYTVAPRSTMGPSRLSGEGQGVEMRCGACAKSRVAFVGEDDPGMATVAGKAAEAFDRALWVRRRRFLTTPNPAAADLLHPWYTFTAYSGGENLMEATYGLVDGPEGRYAEEVRPGFLLCVNTIERLKAAEEAPESAAHFTWDGGCQGFDPFKHRFWAEDNWPLPGW